MAASCVFCRIVQGDIPSWSVYSDGHAFAFLDIAPLAKGHTLVVPSAHHSRLEAMPADEAAGLFAAVHRLVPRVQDAAGAPATTIAFNNGPEAGQEVAHVHAHIVPRFAGDGVGPIHALAWRRPTVAAPDQELLARAIRG